MLRPTARGALPTNVDSGDVRVPGGLRRLQSGWDGRSPSGGFDSRPSPPRGPRTSADVFRNRHTLGLFEIRFTDVRGRLRSVTLIAAGKLTVDYASTINRAQGSAVDEAHLIVDDRINAQQLYIGLPVDPARAWKVARPWPPDSASTERRISPTVFRGWGGRVAKHAVVGPEWNPEPDRRGGNPTIGIAFALMQSVPQQERRSWWWWIAPATAATLTACGGSSYLDRTEGDDPVWLSDDMDRGDGPFVGESSQAVTLAYEDSGYVMTLDALPGPKRQLRAVPTLVDEPVVHRALADELDALAS
jgi:hypothetical protein